MCDLANALKKARKQAGLTQVELSKRSGISQADISRLENGTGNPSVLLLRRLADAMDMTLSIKFVPRTTKE